MSNWHGGKGSRDRTSNKAQFKSNMENIDWSKDISTPLVVSEQTNNLESTDLKSMIRSAYFNKSK